MTKTSSIQVGEGSYLGWRALWLRGPEFKLALVPDVGGRIMGIEWRGQQLAFANPDLEGRTEQVAGVEDVRARKRALGLVLWGGDKTWLAPQARWTDEAPFLDLKRFSNRPCTTWGGRGTSARTDAGGPMRAYSMDLRERALLDSDAGMTAADVAAKYRVSGSWVRLLKQRRRETGEVAPRVQRQGRRGMLEPHLHTLADLIAAHPDRTLAERKDALATPASVPTVWRAVRALGLTVKQHGPPVRTRSA